MKLLARYNRVTLVTTIFVMVFTGLIYYLTISHILTNKIDDDLNGEENEAFSYVRLNHRLPQEFNTDVQHISFTLAPQGSVKRRFDNVDFFNKHECEHENGRALTTSVNVNGKYYKIYIVQSKVETEELIRLIFIITLGVILLLLIMLMVINRLLLNRLWQPFYHVLSELKLFNVTDSTTPGNVSTNIDEFRELSAEVNNMANRVKNDYKAVKSFNEVASHELLTPIAVINSKLDTLLQTANFTEEQSNILSDLFTAVNRLNRLNQSLLLLLKLENKLDLRLEKIEMDTAVAEILSQLEEFIATKNISVKAELESCIITGSRYIIDILLNNLIINATRHNIHNGSIQIHLSKQSLVIRNTGIGDSLPVEQIFERFQKSAQSEGSGLGLTISRQICENLGYRLEYNFEHPYHTFSIIF